MILTIIADENLTDENLTDENLADENLTDENLTDENLADESEEDESLADGKSTCENLSDGREDVKRRRRGYGRYREVDIMTVPEQRIQDVYRILLENEYFAPMCCTRQIRVYSFRQEQYVNPMLTFRQGGIYGGDILRIL